MEANHLPRIHYPKWVGDNEHLKSAYQEGYWGGHNDMVKQIKVTRQETLKEVVEWVEENVDFANDICRDKWLVKRKEWRREQPPDRAYPEPEMEAREVVTVTIPAPAGGWQKGVWYQLTLTSTGELELQSSSLSQQRKEEETMGIGDRIMTDEEMESAGIPFNEGRKAGIREVVRVVEEYEKQYPDFYSHIQVEKYGWRIKLKEWGIDQPDCHLEPVPKVLHI